MEYTIKLSDIYGESFDLSALAAANPGYRLEFRPPKSGEEFFSICADRGWETMPVTWTGSLPRIIRIRQFIPKMRVLDRQWKKDGNGFVLLRDPDRGYAAISIFGEWSFMEEPTPPYQVVTFEE